MEPGARGRGSSSRASGYSGAPLVRSASYVLSARRTVAGTDSVCTRTHGRAQRKASVGQIDTSTRPGAATGFRRHRWSREARSGARPKSQNPSAPATTYIAHNSVVLRADRSLSPDAPEARPGHSERASLRSANQDHGRACYMPSASPRARCCGRLCPGSDCAFARSLEETQVMCNGRAS